MNCGDKAGGGRGLNPTEEVVWPKAEVEAQSREGSCFGGATGRGPPATSTPLTTATEPQTREQGCACAPAGHRAVRGEAAAGVTCCDGSRPAPSRPPRPAPPLSRRDARSRPELRRAAWGECPRGARVSQTQAGPGGGSGQLDALRGPRGQNGGGVHPFTASAHLGVLAERAGSVAGGGEPWPLGSALGSAE